MNIIVRWESSFDIYENDFRFIQNKPNPILLCGWKLYILTWISFVVYQERRICSEIIHVPRTKNLKTDSLARSAKKQSSFVVHMDAELPVWFTESIWVYKSWWQKRKFLSCFIYINLKTYQFQHEPSYFRNKLYDLSNLT